MFHVKQTHNSQPRALKAKAFQHATTNNVVPVLPLTQDLEFSWLSLGEMLDGDRRDADLMRRLTKIQSLSFRYLRAFPWIALPTASVLTMDQVDMFLD
jgi:hypothetical protein